MESTAHAKKQTSQPKSAIKKKFFTPRSAGVSYLIEQFRNFDQDPEIGINFCTTVNKDIKQIYNQHKIFADYSERAFVDQFKRYSKNYQLENSRKRIVSGQEQEETAKKPAAKRTSEGKLLHTFEFK